MQAINKSIKHRSASSRINMVLKFVEQKESILPSVVQDEPVPFSWDEASEVI